MHGGLDFQRHKERGVGSEPVVGRILPFHVEGNRFLEVIDGLVEGGPLGDDGELSAFRHVP